MKYLFLSLLFSIRIFGFEIFEDRQALLTPSSVYKHTNLFVTASKNSFGINRNPLWLKLTLHNPLATNATHYILFAASHLKQIDLIEQQNGSVSVKKNGLDIAIKNRPIPIKEFAFSVPLAPYETKEIFFYIKTKHQLDLTHKIFDNYNDFDSTLFIVNSVNVYTLSTISLMIFMMIVIVIYTKERIYISYLFLLVSTLLCQLFLTGSAQYFYFGNYYDVLTRGSVDFAMIALPLLIIEVLQLKTNMPLFYRFLQLVATFFGFLIVAEFFNSPALLQLRNIIFLSSTIPIAVTLIIAYKRVIPYAGFMLFGWLVAIFSAIFLSAQFLGIIDNFWGLQLWQLGSSIETLTFSIMLLYRAKIIFLEKADQEKKLLKNEALLYKQSRFATIGETLSSIEHQWRSPLAKLSSILMEIQSHLCFKGMPSREHLEEGINEANEVLLYMTDLVDDFKNFYQQDREKSSFYIKNSIDAALKLLHHTFEKNHIQLKLQMEDTCKIIGYPNEFTQVIVNILSNAKEVLIERKVKDPFILIYTYIHDSQAVIEIADNAGGILENDTNQIFEQFFSNKQSSSSGIGLHIAKTIIESRMQGTISAQNNESGAVFNIQLRCS